MEHQLYCGILFCFSRFVLVGHAQEGCIVEPYFFAFGFRHFPFVQEWRVGCGCILVHYKPTHHLFCRHADFYVQGLDGHSRAYTDTLFVCHDDSLLDACILVGDEDNGIPAFIFV
jgi:hypothetical protein